MEEDIIYCLTFDNSEIVPVLEENAFIKNHKLIEAVL